MDFFPFDLTELPFLAFFAAFAAVCLGVALVLRALDAASILGPRGPDTPVEDVPISVYEAAYLRGGRDAPVNAALAGLVADCLLNAPSRADRVSRTRQRPTAWRSAFEKQVYEAVGDKPTGKSIRKIRSSMAGATRAVARSLKKKGLVGSRNTEPTGLGVARIILPLPLIVGTIRLFRGAGEGRAVGLFFVTLFFHAMFTIHLWYPPSSKKTARRTKLGTAVLERLRERNNALGWAAKRGATLTGRDAAVVMGLFGASVFGGGELGALGKGLDFSVPMQGSSAVGGCGGGCGGCGGCGA